MAKLIINKEGKLLLSKEGKLYKTNGSEAGDGLPIEAITNEEMEAALIVDNVGKIYKFIGETNEMFTYGNFYEVIDDGSSNITEPTYVVQDVEGADYGFILDDEGYYVSNNHGVDGSAALCKVVINNPNSDGAYKMIVECTQLTEDGWDYGLLSNLDTDLSLVSYEHYGNIVNDPNVSSLVYFLLPNDFESNRVEYELPSGEHYITVKYSKDGSSAQQDDEFKFKVYFERVGEEPDQPSEPEQPTLSFELMSTFGHLYEIRYEEGMTWGEWLNSEYNIYGDAFYLAEANYVMHSCGLPVGRCDTWEIVYSYEVINPSLNYYIDLFEIPEQPSEPEPTLKTFTITTPNGVSREFSFEEGMTWGDFINSSYNTANITANSTFDAVSINGYPLINEWSEYRCPTDILDDGAYTIEAEVFDEPEQPSEPTEGTAGWYVDGTGEFIPWSTLIENEYITVSGNELTGQGLDHLERGGLVIDNSITSIGYEVFSGCSSLTSIEIPNSVTSIGYGTFSGCSGLTRVVLPESLTALDDSVFSNCTSLVDITIPNNVSSIVYAFDGCSSLETIVIPENVRWISNNTFRDCTNLIIYCKHSSQPSDWDTNWNSDNRPIYWSGEWHYDENGVPTPNASNILTLHINGLGEIQYEEGMTWVDWAASEYNVYDLAVLADYPLVVCKDEKYYEICCENGSPTLDYSDFGYCTFGCQDSWSLVQINFDPQQPAGWYSESGEFTSWYRLRIGGNFQIVDGVINSQTVISNHRETGRLVISGDITGIVGGVFANSKNMTSIILPDSITYIGASAFSSCDNLIIYCKHSSQPSDWDTNWNSDNRPIYWSGEWHYDENGNPTPGAPEQPSEPEQPTGDAAGYYLDDGTFYSWDNLVSDGHIQLNQTTLTGGYSLTEIGSNGELVIPKEIREIGYGAFTTWDSRYNETWGEWEDYCIGANIKSVKFEKDSQLGRIETEAFYNCNSLINIEIPQNMVSIGSSAFSGCSSLTSIILPDSVSGIGSWAFYNCSSLTIYCEAESKPAGWDSNWNKDNRPVYWAGEWHYENGIPTPGAPDPLSKFYINGVEYSFEEGMTWGEWINSEYTQETNFILYNDKNVYFEYAGYITFSIDNPHPVTADELIVANHVYFEYM